MTGGAKPHERDDKQAPFGIFGQPLRAGHRLFARGARRKYRRGRRHDGGIGRQAGCDRRPRAQTQAILEIIAKALEDADAGLEDVIRTRIYLVDIAHWEAVGRVHGEFFGTIRPASSILQVTRFINPDWLVEIEADAVVPAEPA